MAQKFLTNFTPPGTSDLYKFRAGALFYGTTSNSTTAMTVSIPGVTEYYTGLTLILKMGAQAASGCTLNVNNLGAKAMKYGANSVGTYFTSGATYLFVYDGTDFKAVHSYNSNTTYSAEKGITLSSGKFGHTNSITAKTTYNQSTASPGYGGTFKITEPKYDAYGHITGVQVATITMPSAYTHPTSSGNKHIPSGGFSGQILRWSADGTAAWGNDNNTTYSAGTGLTLEGTTFKVTSANVSTMMNLLSEGTALSQQSDYIITQSAGGGTTDTTYYRRKVSNIITADNVKKALGTGTGTTKYLREDGTWVVPPNTDTKVTQTAITASDYTNWRPLIWGASNSGTEGFTPSTVTDGVYTAQTLSCQPSTGTIRANIFKGSLSGNANTASALTTSAGSSTQPIYFSGGKPVAITGSIANSTTGNAATASKLTNLTTADEASSTDTWRRVWFAYNDNATGRPAYSDTFAYQSSTGTVKATKFQGALVGNASTATKLATKRTIALTGSITGSGTFDGSGNLSIATTTNHSHSYLPLSGGTMTGNITMSGSVLYPYSNSMTQTAPSSTTYYEPIQWYDKNNKRIGAIGTTSYANGDFATHIQVQREINGTNYYQQLYMIISANGTGFCRTTKMYGAVWNDYAEFRICNEDFKPGQVVLENGDDTLSIASKRLQRGCSIISDTFGFAIGETDEAKCPIAVSGRVLAYGYESREEFKKHIGWPVCSGPNGTVSIMTEEEEEKYPSRIIGTISAVPDYETWGTGNVEVNNRIWIKVK